eukprot:gene14293-biopygen17099
MCSEHHGVRRAARLRMHYQKPLVAVHGPTLSCPEDLHGGEGAGRVPGDQPETAGARPLRSPQRGRFVSGVQQLTVQRRRRRGKTRTRAAVWAVHLRQDGLRKRQPARENNDRSTVAGRLRKVCGVF